MFFCRLFVLLLLYHGWEDIHVTTACYSDTTLQFSYVDIRRWRRASYFVSCCFYCNVTYVYSTRTTCPVLSTRCVYAGYRMTRNLPKWTSAASVCPSHAFQVRGILLPASNFFPTQNKTTKETLSNVAQNNSKKQTTEKIVNFTAPKRQKKEILWRTGE